AAAQQTAHVRYRAELAARLDGVTKVEPLLVPAHHARADGESLERQQRTAVADGGRRGDRPPSPPEHFAQQPRAAQDLHSADVHHGEIAAAVHVDVEIEIVRPDAHGDRRLVQDVELGFEAGADQGPDEAEEDDHRGRAYSEVRG